MGFRPLYTRVYMYLLTVSPLATGIPYEELSYFSKIEVAPGDLVEITIRKRICRALVLQVVNAHEEKQSLKQASFVTKKISKVLVKEFLHPKIWQALAYSSSYMIRSIGTLIYDLLSEKSFDTAKVDLQKTCPEIRDVQKKELGLNMPGVPARVDIIVNK